MILDIYGKVSANQQITADAVSTNGIDNGNVTPKRAIGTGEVLGFGVFIKAVGTQTGSAILSAISSAASNLGTPTKMASINLATADLALGKKWFIPIPPGQPILRYIGVDYDITGTVDFTVDAFLMPLSMFESAPLVAKGYTIQ